MEDKVIPILPQGFKQLGGFMGRRFFANQDGRLKDHYLSEGFIRLHEAKNHDDWFWLGEQIGKWLDASTYSALISGDETLLGRVNETIHRLEGAQAEDGYLGITSKFHRNPVRGMELYEMYYVLLGLIVVYEFLENSKALEIARHLADYIIQTWGPEPGQFPLVGRYPGNGHDGGEGTLILEPIVVLGIITGDKSYIEWGESVLAKWDEWWDQSPESNHSCGWTMMQQFANGEVDVYELRPNMHAHTYHMTLLGIAALYNATGKEIYQQVVLKSIDRIMNEWLFLTGGMSSGERYVEREYYHPRNDVEVCPQHTWILLLDQALRWTGEAKYAGEIERDLFNHFLAAQLADGSNWSYMTALNGQAQEPYGPNCCNASGHRIAGRMPTFLYGHRDGGPAVFMFTQSEASLELPDHTKVTIQQETDYPSQGQVKLTVSPEQPANFAFHIRIPPFAEGTTYQLNAEPVETAPAGEFLIIDRQWQEGDIVSINLPMPLTVQANEHLAAVVRGPLVYCLFQDIQDKKGTIYWHRGIYPEDNQLFLEVDILEASVREEPARDDLLGPVLRIDGQIMARAPLFSSSQANDQTLPAESQSYLLLPFANQGAIRGPYRIFNNYQKPSEFEP
jgi:DUF1680 family protein